LLDLFVAGVFAGPGPFTAFAPPGLPPLPWLLWLVLAFRFFAALPAEIALVLALCLPLSATMDFLPAPASLLLLPLPDFLLLLPLPDFLLLGFAFLFAC
jgi:hypothetical protein